MFRAMAWKEFREIRGIAVAAVIVYGVIAYTSMHSQNDQSIPFVRDPLVKPYCFFAALAAIAFGLWQTFGESLRGTYPFLLHRPASHRWLVGMKLLVGAAVYLLATAVPLLIYNIWAATPGNNDSPFEWSMTYPSWKVWFAMPVLYLGALLSGVRPGRWRGTRPVPLAAAAAATIAAALLPLWPISGLPIVLLATTLL